jgi:hypothetical protein
MDERRYQAELNVLQKKLASNLYRFIDMDKELPYIVMAARTNRGNIYTLRIELDEFPNDIPKVFVMKMLKTKDGHPMNDCSASMHTLSSEHGWTRICHYGSSWTPSISIYKVYVRCRLWLEMYEQHFKTGNPLYYYLDHDSM